MSELAIQAKLKALYQSLQEEELWPEDPRYVEMFEAPRLALVDPVERLAKCIEFAVPESVQLFSGHRGTGKSTQLRRLARRLERDDTHKVVICDMETYLPMADTIDVVDFLLAAAGALSDALSEPHLLGKDPLHDYWGRFVGWLRSQRIAVEELGLEAKAPGPGGVEVGGNVKLNLKSDPEFRQRVRERMRLHVGAFRIEVHNFAQECLKRLRKRFKNEDLQLVVIYDSIEHLRGTTANAPQVAASVDELFRAHAESLRFPFVHTVFTVPPWLRLQYAGTGRDSFNNYCQVPCVTVYDRSAKTGNAYVPDKDGLDLLWELASKRGDMQWLLGDPSAFAELALVSGGHLRGLFRLLADATLDAASYGLPVSDARRRLLIDELRNAYQGFTNREAAWLQRIEDSGKLDVGDLVDQFTLARFLDTHVLLAYRNGTDWYCVHPVIRDDVARRATAWAAEQAAKDEP